MPVDLTRTEPVNLTGTVTVCLAGTVAAAAAGRVPCGYVQQQLIGGRPRAGAVIRLRQRRRSGGRLRSLQTGAERAETGQLVLQAVSVGRLEPAAHREAASGTSSWMW